MPHVLCLFNHRHLYRLLDIVHADQKLYLVFEFLDVDLKRFMEQCNQDEGGMSMDLVKVCNPILQLPARPSLDCLIIRPHTAIDASFMASVGKETMITFQRVSGLYQSPV
jgi:hypothetical protein